MGFLSLLALGINGVVGVGIFFAPAEVAALIPGTVTIGGFTVARSVVGFALTALAMIPVALTIGLLGSRFDQDGGPVLYARAAFGELAGFVVGWLAYVSSVFSAAAIHVGLMRALADAAGIASPWAQKAGAVGLVLALSAIVAAGIGVSARVWSVLTILKLVPLLLLLVAWLVVSGRSSVPQPEATQQAGSWLRAGLTIAFTYQGFEIVPMIAGQARSSARTIPLATLGALLLSGVLYLFLQQACVSNVADLAHASSPLVAAGQALGGDRLGALLRAGTSVSALGIAFGMMAMTPRFLSALARVSHLGAGLSDESQKGTPRWALAVTVVMVSVLVMAGSLGELFTLSSIAVITQHGIGACALAVLAFRRQRGLILRHAWSVIPTLGVVAVLLTAASAREWGVAAGVAAVGIVLRALRRKTQLAPTEAPRPNP